MTACSPADSSDLKPDLHLGKTNLLLITVNSLSRDRLGIFGADADVSPYMDDLAKYGYSFHWVAAASPDKRAAVAAMITGLDPRTLNLEKNGPDTPPRRLHDRFVTLAERFADQGYWTAGLTSDVELGRVFNFQQGYEVYEDPTDFDVQGKVTAARINKHFLARWRDQAKDRRPFFAHLIYTDCEEPYLSRLPDEVKKDPRRDVREPGYVEPYNVQIDYVDEQIAKLMATLEAEGAEDTLIVITSDHGKLPKTPSSAGGGVEPELTDDALLVPLIFYHPQLNPAWTRYYELVRTVDLFPTVLELMGFPNEMLKPNEALAGQSRVPLITGLRRQDPSPLAVALAGETDQDKSVIYEGEWKLIVDPSVAETEEPASPSASQTPNSQSDRRKHQRWSLYNYRRDPKNKKYPAEERMNEVLHLSSLYDAWRQRTAPAVTADEITLTAEELERWRASRPPQEPSKPEPR